MWVVINIKTKKVYFEGATYKQCLNYIDLLHRGSKENLNIVVKE